MAKPLQSNTNRLVMVILVIIVMILVTVKGCQQIREECRLVSLEEDRMVTLNISCYCEHNEDVSHLLHQLKPAHCLEAAGKYVNTSVVHINGCRVSSKFPESLLATCRKSTDLELYVKDSPHLSLSSPDHHSTAPTLRTITATFINSNVSGMPSGVVSGARVKAVVRVEGGQMGVLESRSFSDYHHDAQVSVTFKNTVILTVMQGAFDLPPAAQVEVEGGQMVKIDTLSYSGGAKLSLSGVRVFNLLSKALSIYGLMKLNVTNCVIASVYAEALTHRPPTYVSTIKAGQEVLVGSEAIFSNNRLMTGNSDAFLHLCTVDKLSWHNNTMVTFNEMPLRLQGPSCTTQRDWSQVFSVNGLSCLNCTDFSKPDDQSCGLYESGYCNSCDVAMDQCNKPVLPYLIAKCRASHPHIAMTLNNTCTLTATSRRSPKALQVQGQEQGTAGCACLVPLSAVVTLAMMLIIAVLE